MPNHPVYEKAKAEAAASGHAARVDTADVAKLIRSQLKARFPKTTFSVRIDRYAGGSSTRVSWTDGPTDKLVRQVTDAYAGGGFDGMIDMAYDSEAFLMPDGSAAFAETSGTEGSMGVVPAGKAFKPHPDAVRVRFGGLHRAELLQGRTRAGAAELRRQVRRSARPGDPRRNRPSRGDLVRRARRGRQPDPRERHLGRHGASPLPREPDVGLTPPTTREERPCESTSA